VISYPTSVAHPLPKGCPVDAVSIAEPIPWNLRPGKRFDDLLRRPLCCGVLRDVKVHHTSGSCARITRTKSTRNVMVGTVQKSRATRSCMGFLRNVSHVGDRGFRWCSRYFSTVDLATSKPSVRSAPTIRGVPYVGLDRHMAWISARSFLARAGRLGLPRWLSRRQCVRNRRRCQAIMVCGCTNARAACQPGHRRTATPKTGDRMDGAAGGVLSVGRWPIGAVTRGLPGAVRHLTGTG
jgi:hypothetical protein